MVVVGPLVGLGGLFGFFGALIGLLIGVVIQRRAKDPSRVALIASWSWVVLLVGGGVAIGIDALWLSPPDAFNGAVALFFVWVGIANGVSGAVMIHEVGSRQARAASDPLT
jgi:vacuolar-type H+-ATPase subunit I/STV1